MIIEEMAEDLKKLGIKSDDTIRRCIVVYVNKLSSQTPEPTLNHYVVRPSGFTIHALTDSILTK